MTVQPTASVLQRVPDTVLLCIGVPRHIAYQRFGMRGCGLQLDDQNEFDWPSSTITVLLNQEWKLFLKVNGKPFTDLPTGHGYARVDIPTMRQFIASHEKVKNFLDLHSANRWLRLGSGAFLEPWELDSQQAYLVDMPSSDFDRYYVSDPRGNPTFSEISRRSGRHSPVLRGPAPPGIPSPGRGGWI